MVALEQLSEVAGFAAKEVGKGLVNFLPRCGAGALVEVAIEPGVELEEVESLHVEPLVEEAGDKFVGTRIGNKSIDLTPESVRIAELATLSE